MFIPCLGSAKRMETPQVSIIIPVFNQAAYTSACLQALCAQAPSAAITYEIVVVDNGSSDETASVLQNLCGQHPFLRVLSPGKNLGYSHGNNLGAKEARGQYLVLLNNDTIPEGEWLAVLLQALQQDRHGIVAPKLLYPDTRCLNHFGYVHRQSVGGFYPLYHNFPGDFAGVSRTREFQAVLGACMLMPKQIFFDVGMLENFGLEDIDLCLKVREQGFKISCVANACVLHHGSVTLRKSPVGTIEAKSAHEFLRRWTGRFLADDDLAYYLEDGIRVATAGDGVLQMKPATKWSPVLI